MENKKRLALRKGMGDKIRALRHAKGISIETMANEMDVSRVSLARWETGWYLPRMTNLLALAKYFNVRISEIA